MASFDRQPDVSLDFNKYSSENWRWVFVNFKNKEYKKKVNLIEQSMYPWKKF